MDHHFLTRADAERATLRKIRRTIGVADQVEISAEVSYGGREWRPVSFVGSLHGTPGPVVMISDEWDQLHIAAPSRYGDELNEEWVRRFYA